MSLGVIKLGARISFNANDTSGGNGEARSIIKMLSHAGQDVHIFTKILAKDNLVPDFSWHNLQRSFEDIQPELDNLDALIVLNGSVNFFGGAEDKEQLNNYKIINSFKGPVFYILCDPELTLTQVWPSVSKKPWGVLYSEDELNITRNDIHYICQPFDTQAVLDALKSNEVKPASITHFPFEQFPCMNDRLPFNENPEVDLSYGGTMRGGKRIAKMIKYYFGHPKDISVEMFGKIDIDDFLNHKKYGNSVVPLRKPNFTGPVRYDEMLPKMNMAMCHCAIGDPWYEKIDDLAQRIYESINANIVTFIDADLDPQRRVYSRDSELSDFLYVNSREELSEKIQLLKDDIRTRREIVESQFRAINFTPSIYCQSFVNLIESGIRNHSQNFRLKVA